MSNFTVENRMSGEIVYAYSADTPEHTDTYPFSTYNHIIKKPEPPAPISRRVSNLEFIARLGDAAFEELLSLAKTSISIEKFVKMIDWATPEGDFTSIDLDDPRVQSVALLEPLLISRGVVVAGWAAGVLA